MPALVCLKRTLTASLRPLWIRNWLLLPRPTHQWTQSGTWQEKSTKQWEGVMTSRRLVVPQCGRWRLRSRTISRRKSQGTRMEGSHELTVEDVELHQCGYGEHFKVALPVGNACRSND